nr:3-keto-5-aminohexanoate cleavage protein [uncultured Cohaesibacter sp.]
MALHMRHLRAKIYISYNILTRIPCLGCGAVYMLGIPKPLIVAMSANGMRRSKRDHIFLPIKPEELKASAIQAKAAGASIFSCAPRDARGQSSLDVGVCGEVVAELREALATSSLIQLELDLDSPDAVETCRTLLGAVKPDACLLPFAQLFPRDGDESDEDKARDLLDYCNELSIGVQFAMEDPGEIDWFYAFRQYGVIPENQHALLFILGEDGEEPNSDPHSLRRFLAALDKQHLQDVVRWSVASFGIGETASLAASIAMGGHVAPGWAYNVHTVDGDVFSSQQEQIAAFGELGRSLGRSLASAFEARTLLFGSH